MSNREIAIGIVTRMSDKQIDAFISLFADDNLVARIEADNIAYDSEFPAFDNVEDLVEDLLSE